MQQEKERIKQAKQGDANALALLIQHHYSYVYKYLVKVTMDPKAAEDLTQDTMMKCMENIHRYDGTSAFSSWLMTIATRLFIDLTRRRKRERQWLVQDGGLNRLKWHFEANHEEWSDFLELMFRLSPEHRIAILLKHYYGYSYDEIGSMLNIPAGTIKSRVAYGIRELRKGAEST
ncbi:RNA polymerase, sigma subunit, SigY [Fontibacillus panacisegetis]|uniref:RNA polymerase, sigma subunit, SigY n=1 Tax=Fontibacillus panacisegetis TaxID=670482 RepID=A0A1G7UJE0_9BACL|nr:RNA polymerase sigma factor SigY [Fontibacillus panacisegetis]SDG47675.1 RNA polymerase, sigma subunit, SigY [Fontibacillus panacisegetis]